MSLVRKFATVAGGTMMSRLQLCAPKTCGFLDNRANRG